MTRATGSEWARRVEEWQSSGLSVGEYAKREGYSAASLRYWAAKQNEPGPRFIEVERPAAGLEVSLPAGVSIRVMPGFDADLLRAVVAALREP